MYLHFKAGFIEADRWDGRPVPVHAAHLSRAAGPSGQEAVIVVRSRELSTIESVIELIPSASVQVIKTRADGVPSPKGNLFARVRSVAVESPKGWDYEFRCYLSAEEFVAVLTAIAIDLDYRNFKSWCGKNAPDQSRLAHGIWHEAHDAAAVETIKVTPTGALDVPLELLKRWSHRG